MISFATPYWSGRDMMTVHLASIRRFYPEAPILVVKKGGGADEMEAHRAAFGIEYWLDDCSLFDAHLRLLKYCKTDLVCVLDHDVVLLSSLERYETAIANGEYDLLGVEERIREPADVDWRRADAGALGWLRLAPAQVACNFLLFNVRSFVARFGLRGVVGRRVARSKDYELDYGIAQRLTRHKYLMPYHARKYGLGNLLMDDATPVAWHQWYGAHAERRATLGPFGSDERTALIERGQRAFLADYPRLDLSEVTPAWGPERDISADVDAILRQRPGWLARAVARVRGVWKGGVSAAASRAVAKLGRWRGLQ